LLRELVSEVRLMRQELARQRRPSHLTRRDRVALAGILPVVAGAVGSEWRTARELVDDPAAALRVALAGLSARSLGRLFQRAEGEPIDGLVVENGGSEVHATLWRVMST
jgi:hypothetical protein